MSLPISPSLPIFMKLDSNKAYDIHILGPNVDKKKFVAFAEKENLITNYSCCFCDAERIESRFEILDL